MSNQSEEPPEGRPYLTMHEEMVSWLHSLGYQINERGEMTYDPPDVQHYEDRHYAQFYGGYNRYLDFDRHYEAVSLNPQRLEVEQGLRMVAPDPDGRLPHPDKDGDDYYIYGPDGWGGDAPIFGDGLDNLLRGRNGDDFIYGGDGNDTIYGGRGRDVLDGGRGADQLFGNHGNDMIFGGLGDDYISGGKGDDDIGGGYGDDVIRGGRGDDIIHGDWGDDILYGGKGDDLISGGGGSDIIYGGKGNDTIRSVGENGKAYGGKGNDDLGGPGTFYFRVGDGQDTISGHGLGDDIFISFEEIESIKGFDDLRIEKLDGSVHPGAHTDGSYRVWYSKNDFVDVLYGTPVNNPNWPLPEAPTADDFLFS